MSNYNNIFNKKNVEFSIEEKNYNLPYSEVGLTAGQLLFNPVNEAFQKLLDNDLYNDALLKQYINEGNDGSGPSFANSIEEVLDSAGTDKKFVISGENGISVVHKGEIPISKTLKGPYLPGKKVNRITFLDDSFFAATNAGLYVSKDKQNWNLVLNAQNVDFVDFCYNYNYLIDSESLISSFDWIVVGNENGRSTRFFAHSGIDNSWTDFANDANLSSFNNSNIAATKLFSFENDKKIYVGTSSRGLWSFRGKKNERLMKESGTLRWKINDMVRLDGKKNYYENFFLATSYGLKQSRKSFGFKDLKEEQYVGNGIFCYDVLRKGNSLYVATTNGLLIKDLETETDTWVSALNRKVCNSLIEFRGNVYVATSAGIYSIDDNSFKNNSVVSKLIVFDNKVFAQIGDNQIKYFSSDFSTANSIVLNSSINKINQLIVNGDFLYLATDVGIYGIYRSADVVEEKFWLQQNDLSDIEIKFSKNVSPSEVIIQDNNNKIYSVVKNGGSLEKTELTAVPNGTITDVLKTNGNAYVFISNGTIHINDTDTGTAASKIENILLGNSDGIISGLVFIDNGNVFLSNDANLTPLQVNSSNAGDFIDIGKEGNVLYGTTASDAWPFTVEKTFSLEKESSLLNVEDTQRKRIERIVDEYGYDLSSENVDVKASHSSISVDAVSKQTSNLKAIDYVGYASETTSNERFVIAAFQNGLSILRESDLQPVASLTGPSAKFFTDSYIFDEYCNLSNAYNFLLGTDNKVYYKKPEATFFEDLPTTTANYAVVLSDSIYVENDLCGIFVFSKLSGNTSICSEVEINNLLNVEDKLVACGNRENGIIEIDGSAIVENDYFKSSISPYFLSGERDAFDLSVKDFDICDFDATILSIDNTNKQVLSLTGDLTDADSIQKMYLSSGNLIIEDLIDGYVVKNIDLTAYEISVDRINQYDLLSDDIDECFEVVDKVSVAYDLDNFEEKSEFSTIYSSSARANGTADLSDSIESEQNLCSFEITLPQSLNPQGETKFVSSISAIVSSENVLTELSSLQLIVHIAAVDADDPSEIIEDFQSQDFDENLLEDTVFSVDFSSIELNGISINRPISVDFSVIAGKKDGELDPTVDFGISVDFEVQDGYVKQLPILYQSSPFIEKQTVFHEENDDIKQTVGYFFKISGEYVGYDGENVVSYSNFDSNEETRKYGFVYIDKTDFVAEEISTFNILVDGVWTLSAIFVLSSYSNNSFNDLFYYDATNEDDPTPHVLSYPNSSNNKSSNTDYTTFFKSNKSGIARCVKSFNGNLYVGTTNGILSSGQSDFPELKSVSGTSGTITKIVSNDDCLYAETSNKIFIVSANGNLTILDKSGGNVFKSNDTVYYSDGTNISSFNGTTVTRLQINGSNINSSIFGYLLSDEYYRSSIAVADNGIYYEKLAYDFSTGYDLYQSLTGINDIKTIIVGDKQYLLVADNNSIVAKDIYGNSSDLTVASYGADTFGYTSDGNLVFLNGTTFYCSKDSLITEDNQLTTLTAFTTDQNAIESNVDVSFNQINELGNGIEIGISESDHYSVASHPKLQQRTTATELPTGHLPLKRFLKYNDGNLYLVAKNGNSNGTIYGLSSENGWAPSVTGQFKQDALAVNNEGFWSFYSNEAELISISSYALDPVPPNTPNTSLFKVNNDVFYYNSSINGVYAKETRTFQGYQLSSDASYGSNGKNANALEFFNQGKDYVYNQAMSVLISGYSYDISVSEEIEGISSIIRISRFETSDVDLSASVNRDYITSDPVVSITKIGNSIFFAGNADGYVYDLKEKEGSEISFDQLEGINGASSMLTISKNRNGKHYLAYGNSLMSTNGFENVKVFGEPTSEYAILANNFRTGTNKIEIISSDSDFLIGSSFGLKYVYDKLMTRAFYNKEDRAQSINGNVTTINKVGSNEAEQCFVVSQANELYEVTGLKTPRFLKILTLPDNSTVLDVFSLQKNEYLIATTKGLYFTSHRYGMVDDLTRFTINSVYKIINEELAKVIKNHVSEDHTSESFITEINKKESNKLDFLSTKDKHVDRFDYSIANGIRAVENDIIDTIEIGGNTVQNSYVKVAVKNWATSSLDTDAYYSDGGFISKFVDPTSGKTFDISVVPYIVKNWKSGLKEIYLYVPTTATYYINNPAGMSNSMYSYNSIQRKNVPNVSNVNKLPDTCTTLRVYLYNSHFRIRTILAAQCFGNSLPLKIYKDNVNADDSWKGFFDTLVQPSALRTLPTANSNNVNNVSGCTDELDRIFLDFSVYGTDAQAIRIIAET